MDTTMTRQLPLVLTVAILVGILASRASAITIQLVNGGGAAPGNAVGGGTLTAAITAGKLLWEDAILDPHVVTITYSWGAVAPGNLAEHNLVTQAGGRETSGTIVFDNGGTSLFFNDPTPAENSEWGSYTQAFENNVGGGGGNMNVARFFSGPNGLNANRYDLFSVALHELGHSLGLSSLNLAYQGESWPDNDVDVAAPLPHAGAQIPTNNSANPTVGLATSNAHIPLTLNQYVLMNPGHVGELGIREYASCADILANAEISQWTQVNCQAIVNFVPEPSTLTLLGLGLVGLAVRRRRTAK